MSQKGNAEQRDKRLGELFFYASRSQRYHEHRYAFFGKCLRGILFLNLVLGSSAAWRYFASEASEFEAILLVAPLVAAITSAWIVSFKVVELAATHFRLYEAWNNYEQTLRDIQKPTAKDMARLEKRRLDLEKLEPPVYHAVNRMCRNEVIRSYGLSGGTEHMKLRHWWFKDVYRFKRMLENA